MKILKFLALTVFLVFSTVVCSVYAIVFAACGLPFRVLGCDAIAEMFHCMTMNVLELAHVSFDVADSVMRFPKPDDDLFKIPKQNYSVAYFDEAWNNLSATVVESHCNVCAKHDAYSHKAANYAAVVVEAI